MTTYAKATNVRVPYLTEGREYSARDVGGGWFEVTSDSGMEVSFAWENTTHATFQRIEKEEA